MGGCRFVWQVEVEVAVEVAVEMAEMAWNRLVSKDSSQP